MNSLVSNPNAFSNSLIHESSPYLLQHAHNPVKWYPWGKTAFKKAREQNKPLLVSIGYSTCHWCHVMEQESFSDPKTAEVMNRIFVNIKVDREERPDIDTLYMTAVQMLSNSGGWPLNVFLTPDLLPFFGGTYFPPVSWGNRASWTEVLENVGRLWNNPEKQKKILSSAKNVQLHIATYLKGSFKKGTAKKEFLNKAVDSLKKQFDRENGGFSQAPKFPMPGYSHFLLFHSAAQQKIDTSIKEMILLTLKKMQSGGIWDVLGGGFHRYSTDTVWHVPHFEKMLYDNAQLVTVYTRAFQMMGEISFAGTAQSILNSFLQDRCHPEGGFYSAEDADSLPEPNSSKKIEGAFYVWTQKEIEAVLGSSQSNLFCQVYGVQSSGNVRNDPHGDFIEKNILFSAKTVAEVAKDENLSENEVEHFLNDSKQKLLEIRNQRVKPHSDDKILTSWNGLMISALASATIVFKEEKYKIAAKKTVEFIQTHLYSKKTLFRSYSGNRLGSQAVAEDYAFLVQGLLDLFEVESNPDLLNWALELTEIFNETFFDPKQGGYFLTSADCSDITVRIKSFQDNVEPSANSVAILNLLRLFYWTSNSDFLKKAHLSFEAIASKIPETLTTFPVLLTALEFSLANVQQIVLVGNPKLTLTKNFLEKIRKKYRPLSLFLFVKNQEHRNQLEKKIPFLKTLPKFNFQVPTVFICEGGTCQSPKTDPEKLSC